MTSRASSRVGVCRNHLAAKATLGEQRQTAAMVKVELREKDEVNAGRIEPEVAGIFLGHLVIALIKSAIDLGCVWPAHSTR